MFNEVKSVFPKARKSPDARNSKDQESTIRNSLPNTLQNSEIDFAKMANTCPYAD